MTGNAAPAGGQQNTGLPARVPGAALKQRRADLISHAKRLAGPFAEAVARRSEHHISLLTAGLSRDELVALAIVCAEAADPGDLRAVTRAADDGRAVPAAAWDGHGQDQEMAS